MNDAILPGHLTQLTEHFDQLRKSIFFGFDALPVVGVEKSGIEQEDKIHQMDSPAVQFVRDRRPRSDIGVLADISNQLAGIAADPAEILKHFFRCVVHANVAFFSVRDMKPN